MDFSHGRPIGLLTKAVKQRQQLSKEDEKALQAGCNGAKMTLVMLVWRINVEPFWSYSMLSFDVQFAFCILLEEWDVVSVANLMHMPMRGIRISQGTFSKQNLKPPCTRHPSSSTLNCRLNTESMHNHSVSSLGLDEPDFFLPSCLGGRAPDSSLAGGSLWGDVLLGRLHSLWSSSGEPPGRATGGRAYGDLRQTFKDKAWSNRLLYSSSMDNYNVLLFRCHIRNYVAVL